MSVPTDPVLPKPWPFPVIGGVNREHFQSHNNLFGSLRYDPVPCDLWPRNL
jgi:hypothetical protein